MSQSDASHARGFPAAVAAGLCATAAHYAVLFSLVEGAGWGPVAGALAGFLCGGVISYLLNKRFTFASHRPHREVAWRFAFVATGGFCATGVLMSLFVVWLGAPYKPAQVVTTGLVFAATYACNARWTFTKLDAP